MKYTAISYQPESIQQIRADLKTQTRRLLNPQPIINTEVDGHVYRGDYKGAVKSGWPHNWQQQYTYEFSPYGQVGDILWVKETWGLIEIDKENKSFVYKGDSASQALLQTPGYGDCFSGWKSPRFMPKAACRTYLRIKDIGIEQLGDLTMANAIAEGYPWLETDKKVLLKGAWEKVWTSTPQSRYADMWFKIHKRTFWQDMAKWVWKITFERIEKP